MRKWLISLLYLFGTLCIAACGGGGSSSTVAGNTVVITGVAAKGVIANGSVSAYELLAPAGKGRFLAAATTNEQGQFSLNLGSYTGGVLLEVKGGSYQDEATNTTLPTPTQPQLSFRAAVGNAGRNQVISITPFTEMACQLAGSAVAPTIDAANTLISDLFKIDSIGTKPVPFPSGIPTASAAQQDYTWALATLSQLAKTRGIWVSTLITALSADLADGVLSFTNATDFVAAMNTIASTYRMIPPEPLKSVGKKSFTLKLYVSGTAADIGGINLDIVLPSTVSVPSDSEGQIDSSYVYASGTAAGTNLMGAYHPAANSLPNRITLVIATPNGFKSGEVATLNLFLDAGTQVPIPALTTNAPYEITNSRAVDVNNNDLLLAYQLIRVN